MQQVRKAIFPVGGLGTRFLPATKALPKEMLTVVDKPLIQYAVEEAADAGIEEFIFVTGRNKSAIEDHFDHSVELEATLAAKGKKQALDMVQQMMRNRLRIICCTMSSACFLPLAASVASNSTEWSK